MTAALRVPLCDPLRGYLARREEIDSAVGRVLTGGRYILGPEVSAFEMEFADYLGVKYAVGVASGTDALELSLRALGVTPGQWVLTTPFTAVATVSAIERCGALPWLVDIEERFFGMDPSALEQVLREIRAGEDGLRRVGAILPVHLYGHPARLMQILELADRHGIPVVEDCAQAHGATIEKRKLGGWGRLGAFSFYPTKNLGAMGDGGMIATSDPELNQQVRLLREYGWKERYHSLQTGFNSRLDEIQAAILRVKLAHLDEDNRKRRQIASAYHQGLHGRGWRLPEESAQCCHVFHQYTLLSGERDALKQRLETAGIGCAVYYPVPIHLQPAYVGRLPGRARLEVAQRVAQQVLSLPMFPELEEDGVKTVLRVLNEGMTWE